jgi:hypothetical protein
MDPSYQILNFGRPGPPPLLRCPSGISRCPSGISAAVTLYTSEVSFRVAAVGERAWERVPPSGEREGRGRAMSTHRWPCDRSRISSFFSSVHLRSPRSERQRRRTRSAKTGKDLDGI